MRRRVVVGGLAALGLLRRAAYANVATLPRIGVLSGGSTELGSAQVQVFRDALAQAGYRDGETVVIDVRYAAGDRERFTALARELVASDPDVIACVGRIETAALQAATQTIPIVFMQAPNPLELGLVKSLAHPGGNTTGFTQMSAELDSKRLQLLHELTPQATRVAFLINPTFLPGIEARFAEARSLAQSAGIDLRRVAVTAPPEVEAALEASTQSGAQVLLIQNDPILGGTAVKQIAAFAMAHRLPAIAEDRTSTAVGILLTYGSDPRENARLAAGYVVQILKGARPGDLPVQRPTKFELIINLKTAKAIGITVPQALLAQADELIE
jgi:putative tryptophan/tyrosine transport system substrate-binding protein